MVCELSVCGVSVCFCVKSVVQGVVFMCACEMCGMHEGCGLLVVLCVHFVLSVEYMVVQYMICAVILCILCVVDTVQIVPTTHVVCQIVPCVVYM